MNSEDLSILDEAMNAIKEDLLSDLAASVELSGNPNDNKFNNNNESIR